MLGELTAFLGRPVCALETDPAPVPGLVRVTALRFDDGASFPIPLGNRLRTAGDLAEIRALLAGWPRACAARLKLWAGPSRPADARAAVDAVLEAWALDPDLALADPGCWPRCLPAETNA